jgi:hypothetical protein
VAFQLSGFREKRILQHQNVKLTPKIKLESQGLFSITSLKTWSSCVALKVPKLPFRGVLLHTVKHALEQIRLYRKSNFSFTSQEHFFFASGKIVEN